MLVKNCQRGDHIQTRNTCPLDDLLGFDFIYKRSMDLSPCMVHLEVFDAFPKKSKRNAMVPITNPQRRMYEHGQAHMRERDMKGMRVS